MSTAVRLTIPAMTDEDRLPDALAVWRSPPAPAVEGFRQVCVDYGDGTIERTFVDKASWERVKSWRFGWPAR